VSEGFGTDYGCRDCVFIERIVFPLFCLFRTPRDVVAAWPPDCSNETIQIGGTEISPGDYILAYLDWIVTIPSLVVREVVEAVESVMSTEALVRRCILDGEDPKVAYLRYGRF